MAIKTMRDDPYRYERNRRRVRGSMKRNVLGLIEPAHDGTDGMIIQERKDQNGRRIRVIIPVGRFRE